MWKVSFPEKSRGVATHYKVGGDDEGGNEEKETDTEGKRSKILLMNLVICKISKWDLGDGFKYSRGQKLRFMPNFLFSY